MTSTSSIACQKRWAFLSARKAVKFFLFGLLFASQVFGQATGQTTVTLSFTKTPLETVLKEIRKQTGYVYALQSHWRSVANPVTIHVFQVPVADALRLCFKGQPFTYSIVNGVIVVKARDRPSETPSQAAGTALINVQGRVLDEKKQPVPGVTVSVKGVNRATVSGDDGSFTLPGILGDAVLVFTSINMENLEYRLNGSTEAIVTMKPKNKELGAAEIEANNGYQLIPRERSTGSFDILDKATLNQQVGSNILDRMNGVASGVLFPKSAYLQNGPSNGFIIRGFSTINGPTDPLIVVDNFPYEGNINNINPNDVESITILKDASAASIWGVRAGNGVVVITTKKGHFNQRPQVDFNADVLLTQKPNLHSLRTIGSSNYIDVETMLFNNGYYAPYLTNSYNFPAVSPVVEILNNEQNGTISSAQGTAQINALRNLDVRDQYGKYFYQQAITQQYNVNFHGGSANADYFLSTGYDKSQDQLGAPSDRLTVKLDNVFRPLDRLTITTDAQYTQATGSTGKPGYGSVSTGQWQIPYAQFADASGNPLSVATLYRQGFADTAGQGLLLNWNYYPLTDWKHNYTSSVSRDVVARVGANLGLWKGLSLGLNYAYEHQEVVVTQMQDTASFYARNLINVYSQISGGAVTYIVPVGDIVNEATTTTESQDLRGQLNYNLVKNRSSFAVIGGAEIRQAHTFGTSAATTYGYNDNLAFTNVDFANSYPTYPSGNYLTIPNSQGFTDALNRYVSYYGDAGYTYDRRYTLTASGRRDASNLFGVNTNQKWNPLWSAGLGWQLSNESFYHFAALPYLKMRASYGFSGNINPGLSAVTTANFIGNLYPSNYTVSRINQFPNPDLKWETVGITNLAVDFETVHHLFTGTMELYYKHGFNLFGPAPVDPTLGLNGTPLVTKNVADMKGKGIDFTVNTKILDGKVKWLNTLLFNYSTSITSKYYLDSNAKSDSYVNSGATIDPIVGKPFYSIVAFPYMGLDGNGNPQGYLGKGLTENYDSLTQSTPLKILVYKSSIPVFFGSFINSFSWRSFRLALNISYRMGYYFLRPSLSYSGLYGGGASIGSADYDKRWQHPGDEKKTNVPSLVYPEVQSRDLFYTNSTAVIDKADNIKLQYVNLSYDFTKKQLPFLPFPRLQLYANISNLGILWKANKDGIDPDYISSPLIRKTFAVGVRTNL